MIIDKNVLIILFFELIKYVSRSSNSESPFCNIISITTRTACHETMSTVCGCEGAYMVGYPYTRTVQYWVSHEEVYTFGFILYAYLLYTYRFKLYILMEVLNMQIF